MFDVNQITTTLRGMPDRLLQQYAMMNKGNPYVLSLAVAESNQRKQLRTAAQARAMAPQPKVADAAIASIAEAPQAVDAMGNVTGMAAGGLPEDYGIGRLSAPNIARMADGGIAGYGDAVGGADGGMFNYAQAGSPVVKMSGGGVPGYADGVFNDSRFREFLKAKGITGSQFANADVGEKQKILSEFGKFNSGPQVPPPAAASPTAAATPLNSGKAYELGKAVKPYLDKAGNIVKTGAAPVIGGGLSALEGVSEIDRSKGFYEDPNVPTLEKAKQFTRTAANVGLPYAGGAIGTGLTSWMGGVPGAVAGYGVGTGLASLFDDEGEALKAWKKENPQATPEQTKKAAAKLTPTYSPDDQSNAEARRLGLKVNPNTMSAPPEAAEDAGTGGGGGGFGGGTSAQSVKDMYNLFMPQNQKETKLNSIEQQYKDLASSRTSAAQRDYEQLQADIAARGEYGKDREAKLKGKEERIAKEEGQAGGLALLEAGLAIMSGTSPHAFANIGQGAMAGTAAYRKSQEKLADARDKLDDAYGRLEDVRFNQKSMDAKELRAAKKGVDDATNAGLESLINFTAKRFDIDRDEAGKLLNSYTQLRAHEISAAPGIARNKMLEKQFSGDAKKMAEYGKIQKQVMADLEKDIAYKTANTQAEKDKIMEARLRSAMMNNPFLSSYAMGIGFAAAPTNKVRNEDEDV